MKTNLSGRIEQAGVSWLNDAWVHRTRVRDGADFLTGDLWRANHDIHEAHSMESWACPLCDEAFLRMLSLGVRHERTPRGLEKVAGWRGLLSLTAQKLQQYRLLR